MTHKLLLSLALAGSLAMPMLAHADDDTVLARVNGSEIKKSDVMRELASLPPQLQQIPVDQIYPKLLERMVDSRLLLAEAKKQKLDQSDDFKQREARSDERILTDMVLRAKVKSMITDDKVKAKYDSIDKSKIEEEVKAAHILVKTEAEAKDIIAQLAKGGDFAKLAAEKSADKGSAAQGGELGYFTKSKMVPEFAKAAFAMKVGETSKTPVKTDFGYHVIKVEDRRKITMEELKPAIENMMADEMANQYIEGLRKDAKIETFGLDGKPLPAEGAAHAAAPAPADKK